MDLPTGVTSKGVDTLIADSDINPTKHQERSKDRKGKQSVRVC